MKTIKSLLFYLFFLFILGCTNEESNEAIIQDCALAQNAKVLSEGEGCCAIYGASVYRFDGELYIVQGYCSCNEFIPSFTTAPKNCNGDKICEEIEFEDIQNCLSDLRFYKNAEFLFNISIE